MKLMAILLLTMFAFSALAQTVAPPIVVVPGAPVVTTPVVAPVVEAPVNIWTFIKANWGQVCFALSWIIEGVFYFSPSIKANSFLEQVESWLKGQSVTPTL